MHAGFSFELVNADDYDQLRPEYAPAAAAWLTERAGLGPASLVVDLAAGTGLLSRRLAPFGVTLVAVEPARNMLAAIRDQTPDIRVLAGAAEAIPLRDGVADAIVVGNAFHHFDSEPAFGEICRVLRRGGALAIFWAWDARDHAARYPPLREVQEALDGAVEAAPAASAIRRAYGAWTEPPPPAPGFTPFERAEFPMTHGLASARLADLYATSSDVGSLPPLDREQLLKRIRELSRGLPNRLELPGRTVVDLCFRKPTMPASALSRGA